MARTLGISQVMERQFETIPLTDVWEKTFGHPANNFKMLVYGHPKNGKTSLMMQFGKYLALNFGKVFYNSIEEGHSKSIQDAFIRAKMDEVPPGRFMLGDRYFYADLVEYLKGPNRGKYIFIDSRDYMNLTSHQFKRLTTLYPQKCWIVICWEQAGKPAGKFAKDIEYMVDIVVHVKDYKAYVRSRFGGGATFTIWDRKPLPGSQLTLLG